MEHRSSHLAAPHRLGALVLLGAALVLAGCKRRSGHYHHSVEYLNEFERNDLVAEANFFGTLHPGDELEISGHITDVPFDPFFPNNGHDPFDGFAFVASQPIHVEFRLVSHGWADLDLCVYDPVTGFTEFCFETAAQPEVGAIDVLAGGTEFHLVVESFQGSSSYDLELYVEPLYAYSTDASALAVDGDASAPTSLLRVDAPGTRAAAGRASGYVNGTAPAAPADRGAPDEGTASDPRSLAGVEDADGD